MATLSHNIPVSKVETLLPSCRSGVIVVAVSEMVPLWPVKTSKLLPLLLSEGRAPSQNSADININYYQKRQYITSSSALALCREALTPTWPTCAGGGWKTRRSFNIAQDNSRREFWKANCSASPRDKKNVNLKASEEREEAIQAATKAVSEGQSNASVPLIRLDGLAVPRDALYLQTS